jgi:thioredoxin-like negative regulator of GroEL
MRTLRVALAALGAALLVATPGVAFAQTADEGYYDFLMARHLEASGDSKGAQALLEKAVAADPKSAEVRAELAAFHLRRDAAEDAGASREGSASAR